MTATLSERISAAEAKLSGLRARRGSALLDGESIDAGEVSALEQEIAALQDAQGEVVRRERAAAWQAREAFLSKEQSRLREVFAKYLKDWSEAEKYERAYAAKVAEIKAGHAEMVAIAHELEGKVPSTLAPLGLATRIGNYITAVLSSIPGHRHRIGHLELHQSHTKPGDSWSEAEARLLQETIDKLTEK